MADRVRRGEKAPVGRDNRLIAMNDVTPHREPVLRRGFSAAILGHRPFGVQNRESVLRNAAHHLGEKIAGVPDHCRHLFGRGTVPPRRKEPFGGEDVHQFRHRLIVAAAQRVAVAILPAGERGKRLDRKQDFASLQQLLDHPPFLPDHLNIAHLLELDPVDDRSNSIFPRIGTGHHRRLDRVEGSPIPAPDRIQFFDRSIPLRQIAAEHPDIRLRTGAVHGFVVQLNDIQIAALAQDILQALLVEFAHQDPGFRIFRTGQNGEIGVGRKELRILFQEFIVGHENAVHFQSPAVVGGFLCRPAQIAAPVLSGPPAAGFHARIDPAAVLPEDWKQREYGIVELEELGGAAQIKFSERGSDPVAALSRIAADLCAPENFRPAVYQKHAVAGGEFFRREIRRIPQGGGKTLKAFLFLFQFALRLKEGTIGFPFRKDRSPIPADVVDCEQKKRFACPARILLTGILSGSGRSPGIGPDSAHPLQSLRIDPPESSSGKSSRMTVQEHGGNSDSPGCPVRLILIQFHQGPHLPSGCPERLLIENAVVFPAVERKNEFRVLPRKIPFQIEIPFSRHFRKGRTSSEQGLLRIALRIRPATFRNLFHRPSERETVQIQDGSTLFQIADKRLKTVPFLFPRIRERIAGVIQQKRNFICADPSFDQFRERNFPAAFARKIQKPFHLRPCLVKVQQFRLKTELQNREAAFLFPVRGSGSGALFRDFFRHQFVHDPILFPLHADFPDLLVLFGLLPAVRGRGAGLRGNHGKLLGIPGDSHPDGFPGENRQRFPALEGDSQNGAECIGIV